MYKPRIRDEKLLELSIGSMRSYLIVNRYIFREKWGSHLDRFSRKIGGREDNILLPTTNNISDFSSRVRDLLSSFSEQNNMPLNAVISGILNTKYEIVRVRVNGDDDTASLAYDTAMDLLKGSFRLIDESAALANSSAGGNSAPAGGERRAKDFLHSVKLGQTEIGSFVFTLLLPVQASHVMDFDPENSSGFGTQVAKQLASTLKVVEAAVRRYADSAPDELFSSGLTANFSGALAQMINAAGDLSLSVDRAAFRSQSNTKSVSTKFHYSDLKTLKSFQHFLVPSPELRALAYDYGLPYVATGTIVEFSEHATKNSGRIMLDCGVEGRISLRFERADRAIVLSALERKSEFYLQVHGNLHKLSANRSRLELPHSFELVSRGGLELTS